ncbi:MAG: hypothetical protein U0795_04040 [Pirellulales bacterium]
MLRLTPKLMTTLAACLMAAGSLHAAVIVSEDFRYREPTKKLGPGGGFTLQDYGGGQNGPLGSWGGRWISSGDAIITDPAYATESQREAAITRKFLSVNYLTRPYSIDSSIAAGTPIYFGIKLGIGELAPKDQAFIIDGIDNPETEISIGLGKNGGAMATLGAVTDEVGAVDPALLYQQVIGKLEVNANGAEDRLTVWLNPTGPEQGDQVVQISTDLISKITDLSGSLRLDNRTGVGLTAWDDVAIGTTWQDVAQINIPRLTLEVSKVDGSVKLMNKTNTDIDLRYYEILSAGGSLSTTQWNGLDDQNLSGGIWQENNPTAKQLIESAFQGSSLLAAGNSWNLGKAFQPGKAQDLIARAGSSDGLFNVLDVKYVDTPGSIYGDYDGDADVDSSDLVSFLENWTGALEPGQGSPSPGDSDGDLDVDSADLANFLNSWTGSLSASSAANPAPQAVPEPTLPLWVGLVGWSVIAGRRRRTR